MYADRYTAERRLSPTGMALSLTATGAVLVGLATSAPKIVLAPIKPIINIISIPLAEPPPPVPLPKPTPHPQITTHQQIQRVDPVIDIANSDPDPVHTVDIARPVDPGLPPGTGDGIAIPQPKPPVLIGSVIDGRYAADFQPYYPPSERSIGREGRVVVRVLIGTDGRVHAVEPVSATSDAFLEATRRRALERWRFKPATRDGVAIESWKEMTVRFQIEDQ